MARLVSMAVLAIISVSFAGSPLSLGQSPSATDKKFEVASIKPGKDMRPMNAISLSFLLRAGQNSFEQMRPMLQSLLAERFKLALHREDRELPIYQLTAAKGGLRIVAVKEGSCMTPDPNNPPAAGRPWRSPAQLFAGPGGRSGQREITSKGTRY